MGDTSKNLEQKNLAFGFREAADRVWEMAKEYEAMGLFDLSSSLKEIASSLHDEARKIEKKITEHNN